MTRSLMNLVAALSVLLSAVAVFGWVRSGRYLEGLQWEHNSSTYFIGWGARTLTIAYFWDAEPNRFRFISYRLESLPPPQTGAKWPIVRRYEYGPPAHDGLYIWIPFWIVCAVAALPALYRIIFLPLKARRRAKRGRCRHCGYDLSGNESGRCPECGADTPSPLPTSQAV